MVNKQLAELLLIVLIAAYPLAAVSAARFIMGGVNVTGVPVETAKVNSFLGVPFARAPTGALRWAPPQAWQGKQKISYKADKFAPACFQGPHISNWYKNVVSGFGGDPDSVVPPQVSEDCLYLNIWQPIASADKPFPVIVFIHGGSNKGGWSYEPNYHGESLAAKGVIVVTIAYRLGVFGYFPHPELEYSNFGLLDQIMALQWVQSNIRALSGDPGNVTVMGESAGANNIDFLLASPLGRGLFQRVIHQSGGSGLTGRSSRPLQLDLGEVFASTLLGADKQHALQKMRQIPAEQVLATAGVVYQGHSFGPVVDGHSVVSSLIGAVQDNRLYRVDLLIGSNDDEWLMYLEGEPDVDSWLADNVNEQDAVLLKSDLESETDPERRLDLLITANAFVCPSLLLAAKFSQQKQQVWVYHFLRQRPGELAASMGAYHGAELPYVFDTHDAWLPTDEIDRSLTDRMQSYWVAFAKTGNPNSQGRPYWPAYREHGPTVQMLDDKISTGWHGSQRLCDVLLPI
jgi:para-nitrobenzyl esterase